CKSLTPRVTKLMRGSIVYGSLLRSGNDVRRIQARWTSVMIKKLIYCHFTPLPVSHSPFSRPARIQFPHENPLPPWLAVCSRRCEADVSEGRRPRGRQPEAA